MHHRARSTRWLALLAATALVATACASDDDPGDGTPDDDQAAADDATDSDDGADPEALDPDELDTDELDTDELEDLLEGQQEADLPDPTEHVEDGVFRGVGVTMPTPDGWQLDERSFAQGMVVAIGEDGLHTLAAQAVDTADLDQELDYDQLVDTSRSDLGGEPDADEEVELQGAERAHLLRFDALPPQQEGAPENSLLTVIADDGDGQLAMFNYVAPTDDYDPDTEALLLSQGGFDADSDPEPPAPVG